MWIITNTAFVSIVEHRDDASKLIVRGRFKGDVERFLNPLANGMRVVEEVTPSADYRFRAVVPREEVAHAMLRAVSKIKYPNFKDSIIAKWRKSIAMRVWSIFNREQQERALLR
jgi:hypothetical protein